MLEMEILMLIYLNWIENKTEIVLRLKLRTNITKQCKDIKSE
jgi:hypothetical protein